MKNKYLTKCLCMTILSAMVLTSPLSVMAAEEDVTMSSEGDEFGDGSEVTDPGQIHRHQIRERIHRHRIREQIHQRQTREQIHRHQIREQIHRHQIREQIRRHQIRTHRHRLRDLMMEVKPHRQLHQQINRQLHQRRYR